MPTAIARLPLFLCLLLWSAFACAQTAADALYSAEVPVTGRDAGERTAATARALGQVVVKLTGDAEAPRHPLVARQMRSAEALAQSHDYRQDTETSPSGAPVYRQTLVVRFDSGAVDALIAAAELPMWPAPRPPVALLLAIDDGRGARTVGAQQVNVVRPLTLRAEERGVELRLPRGDAGSVDAVWDLDPAAAAGREPALLGKLYRAGEGWTAEWLLVADGEVERWTSSDGDARRALAGGGDGVAERLAERYAAVVPGGSPETVTVRVDGVRGSEDYLRLASYLQGLAVVRSIVPAAASGGDRLHLTLDLATGLGGFEGLVESGQVLVPMPGGAEPVFLLRP